MRRENNRLGLTRRRAAKDIKTHTYAEWMALLERYKNRCAMCRSTKRLTRDHIIPISLGGDDSIENIQPLCLRCNSSKRNRRLQLI
jgi:5-methylcytosine-specific restriction endonuclease McrA